MGFDGFDLQKFYLFIEGEGMEKFCYESHKRLRVLEFFLLSRKCGNSFEMFLIILEVFRDVASILEGGGDVSKIFP